MGQTTGTGLHVDQHLTNLAINYRPQNFIADQIAPVIPVNKQTDSYPVFSRFEAFAVEDTVRAPGTEAKKITRSVSSAKFDCRNYALGRDITIEDIGNMDEAYRFELGIDATQYLVGKLGLGYEKRVLDLAVTTASVGSVFVVNSSWSVTGANAGDPVAAIFQLIEYAQSQTGQRPNSMLWGWKAWNATLRNYHMRNFINGVNNGKGLVTREQVRSMFEMERLNVSQALWHNANEAQSAVYSLSNPIENQLFIYYAPQAASREEPSWFYSFRWGNPALPAPFVVERHPYDSRKKVETIEAGYYQDERVVGTDYGYRMIVNAASGTAGLGG
jgi:hypothetical protein